MLLLLKLFYILHKLVFVSLTNYGKPYVNTPLVKAKTEKTLTRNPKKLKSASNDYTRKQSQVTEDNPGSKHSCLVVICGYPSVEHFLAASTWIAEYLKTLV